MLINNYQVHVVDPILRLVAEVGNRKVDTRELATGVYEVCHFGSSNFLTGFEDYPDLRDFDTGDIVIDPYGVCDNYQQILAMCPELVESKVRKFVITVTEIVREDQPIRGGWRWHKWGEYIGLKEPQCEHLYDEPDIDKVSVFHIYEKKQDMNTAVRIADNVYQVRDNVEDEKDRMSVWDFNEMVCRGESGPQEPIDHAQIDWFNSNLVKVI